MKFKVGLLVVLLLTTVFLLSFDTTTAPPESDNVETYSLGNSTDGVIEKHELPGKTTCYVWKSNRYRGGISCVPP
jgi:hypothetical protein